MNSNGPQLGDEGKEPYFRAKSTTLMVDETIQFIREHKEGPFYVNLWTLVPHALLKPTPEQLAVYTDPAPGATDPAFSPGMRDYLGQAKDLKHQMQVHCASLTDLDTQLGRLFAALDEMKLADNTIIFFVNHDGTGAQLFNIPKDIGEEHDLAAQNPEVVKSLAAKALDWKKSNSACRRPRWVDHGAGRELVQP